MHINFHPHRSHKPVKKTITRNLDWDALREQAHKAEGFQRIMTGNRSVPKDNEYSNSKNSKETK